MGNTDSSRGRWLAREIINTNGWKQEVDRRNKEEQKIQDHKTVKIKDKEDAYKLALTYVSNK